ncbi:MAG: hypothetical protein ACK55Z_04005, partial [bacterium]
IIIIKNKMLAQVVDLQSLQTANDRVYTTIDSSDSMVMNQMGNAGDCFQFGLLNLQDDYYGSNSL